jgi:hypothetical protein
MRIPQLKPLPDRFAIEVEMIEDWPATWTKIGTYQTCHYRFWLQEGSKYVTGKAEVPFTSNKATELGEKKHDLYERAANTLRQGYLIGEITKNNPLWNPEVGSIIEGLMKIYSHPFIEQKIGIDSTWRPWSLNDYWQPDSKLFGNRKMLVRAKFDLCLLNDSPYLEPTEGLILDYKSGKVRLPETWEQLALYALTAFCRWPKLNYITCIYLWVDHNSYYQQVFTRQEHFLLLKAFFVDQIMQIQHYLHISKTGIQRADKTPGNCHWCNATSAQCEYKQ